MYSFFNNEIGNENPLEVSYLFPLLNPVLMRYNSIHIILWFIAPYFRRHFIRNINVYHAENIKLFMIKFSLLKYRFFTIIQN